MLMPLPENTGVVAGNDNYIINPYQRFFIKMLMNIYDSDGKIHVFETKLLNKKMTDQNFFLVYENHSHLMSNDEVIKMAQRFFAQGSF